MLACARTSSASPSSATRSQHLKAIIFAIGGVVAGLAGSLYAFHEGFVWPNMLGVVVSTQVVLYVLFGGSGTLIGAVIGAVIIEGVSFWLSDNYRDIWPIILGVLLLLVILFRPLGLISFVLGERERVGSFGGPPKGSRRCRCLRPRCRQDLRQAHRARSAPR